MGWIVPGPGLAGFTVTATRNRCSLLMPATPETGAMKADLKTGPELRACDFNIFVTAHFEQWRSREGRTANTTLPPVLQRNGGILCRNMAGG